MSFFDQNSATASHSPLNCLTYFAVKYRLCVWDVCLGLQKAQSLDLLFVLDVTVSMKPYADVVCANMKKIVDSVLVSSCSYILQWCCSAASLLS